jgi:putative NADH-flavin reductase
MLLLGANGRTGREIISISLAANHPITAVVRNKESLKDITHPLLEVLEADVTDAEQLTPITANHEVIISTLGPKTPREKDCKIYSASALAITSALQDQPSKRLLVISTALLFPDNKLITKILRFIARHNAAHAKLMESTIASSALNWTIARVGFLTNKPSTAFSLAVEAMPTGSTSIGRCALANFFYNEAIEGSHHKQIVGLCDKIIKL